MLVWRMRGLKLHFSQFLFSQFLLLSSGKPTENGATLPPHYSEPGRVCVECLIGKQKKPILFKVVTMLADGLSRLEFPNGLALLPSETYVMSPCETACPIRWGTAFQKACSPVQTDSIALCPCAIRRLPTDPCFPQPPRSYAEVASARVWP